MSKYYFTFLMSDGSRRMCYHVEEGTYEEARQKMVAKYGTDWAFQYSEEEWKISPKQYRRISDINMMSTPYQEGMTQADLYNLKEI